MYIFIKLKFIVLLLLISLILKGCVLALEKYIATHIILIAMVSCGIVAFQAIGLLIATFLIKRINQRKQYNYVKANESAS
jgi:hypothetical protein